LIADIQHLLLSCRLRNGVKFSKVLQLPEVSCDSVEIAHTHTHMHAVVLPWQFCWTTELVSNQTVVNICSAAASLDLRCSCSVADECTRQQQQ